MYNVMYILQMCLCTAAAAAVEEAYLASARYTPPFPSGAFAMLWDDARIILPSGVKQGSCPCGAAHSSTTAAHACSLQTEGTECCHANVLWFHVSQLKCDTTTCSAWQYAERRHGHPNQCCPTVQALHWRLQIQDTGFNTSKWQVCGRLHTSMIDGSSCSHQSSVLDVFHANAVIRPIS